TPNQSIPQEYKSLDITSVAEQIYSQSKITTYQGLQELLSGNADEILKKLNNDPLYAFVKAGYNNFSKNINPSYDSINTRIQATQRTYMKAIVELFPDSRIFPDANSTMRITYGKV